MDRLLVMLAVSLLVAVAPATRGRGLLPPNPHRERSQRVWYRNRWYAPLAPVPHGPGGDPMFFDRRGVSELAAGEYGPAIADFDEAIRRDPTNALFYYHRALADFRTDKTDDFDNLDRALGDLFDAILRDPTKTDHYLARAASSLGCIALTGRATITTRCCRNEPLNQEAFREREELKVRKLAYKASLPQPPLRRRKRQPLHLPLLWPRPWSRPRSRR